jgi:hypothetical protein
VESVKKPGVKPLCFVRVHRHPPEEYARRMQTQPPSKRLILRAVLRDVSPMIIRLLSVASPCFGCQEPRY